MTLPPSPASSNRPRAAALDYEIAQEQAAALGRLGRALEAALTALAEYETSRAPPPPLLPLPPPLPPPAPTPAAAASERTRARLVQNASDALWCFMVQREACGLRDPRPVIREYRVPAAVYARMGALARR